MPVHSDKSIALSHYGFLPGPHGEFASVTYPRRTAGPSDPKRIDRDERQRKALELGKEKHPSNLDFGILAIIHPVYTVKTVRNREGIDSITALGLGCNSSHSVISIRRNLYLDERPPLAIRVGQPSTGAI